MGAVVRKPRPRRDGRPMGEQRKRILCSTVEQRSDEAARRSEGIGFRSRQPFHTSLLVVGRDERHEREESLRVDRAPLGLCLGEGVEIDARDHAPPVAGDEADRLLRG